MRKKLAAMGAPPDNDNFYSNIMSLMPLSYSPYISAVNGTASVLGKTLSPDNLMQTLTEEADCHTTNTKKNQQKEKNMAFYGNDSSSSQTGSSSCRHRHGGRTGCSSIECYNCKKCGHTKAECWAKGGGKEGKGPHGKGKDKLDKLDLKALAASTNAKEKTKEKEPDKAWMAMVIADEDEEFEEPENSNSFQLEDYLSESEQSDNDTIAASEGDGYATDSSCTSVKDDSFDTDFVPDLQPVTDDSDDDSDDEETKDLDERSEYGWDEETDKGEGEPMSMEEIYAQLGIEVKRIKGENTPTELKFINPSDEAYTTLFTAAMLLEDGIGNQLINIDLYDSGASRHMSGHCHHFTNFIKIEPRPITTADKRAFDAVGKGDMLINLPNGNATSTILLKNVLYAPSMGVTLVSISQIATAGSTVVFSSDSCRLFNTSQKLVGKSRLISCVHGMRRTSWICWVS